MAIVARGRRNVGRYSFRENWRYTLQRASGVIAMVFILWHVFHMHGWLRGAWWAEQVARPLGGAQFDPAAAPATAAAALQHPLVVALYALGVTACVYHLANGLWTMGITWGVWTGPRAQRRANLPCALVGAALLVVGLAALWSMHNAAVPMKPQPPASADG
jgi:succinate dehydrogenase / fumarate reductase cytochrome b subunit